MFVMGKASMFDMQTDQYHNNYSPTDDKWPSKWSWSGPCDLLLNFGTC